MAASDLLPRGVPSANSSGGDGRLTTDTYHPRRVRRPLLIKEGKQRFMEMIAMPKEHDFEIHMSFSNYR
jgi:hypothetical protein